MVPLSALVACAVSFGYEHNATAAIEGVSHLSAPTNVYLEYDVWERVLPIRSTSDAKFREDILTDPSAKKYRFAYWSDGLNEYWELIADHVENKVQVAWFNGETWSIFEPYVQSGVITEGPPTLYELRPTNYALGVMGHPWSSWIAKDPGPTAFLDTRYSSPVYRIDIPVTTKPYRFMLMADPEWDWLPRRVYQLFDDLLYVDYELKQLESTPAGMVPARYRIIAFIYEAQGHFPVLRNYIEYEIVLRRWLVPEGPGNFICDGFPAGTSIYNMFSQARSIAGASPLASHKAWIAYDPSSIDLLASSGNRWYWEEPQAGFDSGTSNAATFDQSCGPLSLLSLAHLLGVAVNEESLDTLFDRPSGEGMTVHDLRESAKGLGLSLLAVDLGDEPFPPTDVPYITLLKSHKGRGHYVCVEGTINQSSHPGAPRIIDFPRSVRHPHERRADWSGIALVPAHAGMFQGERTVDLVGGASLRAAVATGILFLAIVLVRKTWPAIRRSRITK